MQILEDRIVYDENDWLGGLVPQAANSVALTVGKGAAYQRNVNPFRFLGGICPGVLATSVTNEDIIDSIIKGIDINYNTTTGALAYLIGGSKVYTLNLNSGATLDTLSNTAPWPHTITEGGSEQGSDLKIFTIINGVTSTASVMALYSFNSATGGDVGAFDISSGALNVFYDNFLSTQPTGAFGLELGANKPMIIGDDGALYIGNQSSLAKLVGDGGGNGTLSTPLQFPRGTVIKSFAKYPDYLIIFTSKDIIYTWKGSSTAYFWNYQSKNYNFAYDLSDNEVTAGFNWLGTPGCFTRGRAANGGETSTKLKLFNGTKFEQVLEYSGNTSPIHNGVEIYDSMIIWSMGNQKVGSYGSPWPGRILNSFNYYSETTGSSSEGFCSNLLGKKLYISTGPSIGGGLQILSDNFGPVSSNASYFRGIVARPSFPSQHRGKIKSVKVHFRKNSTAGRTLKLDLYVDGTTTYSTVFTGLGTNTSLTKEYSFDTNNSEFPHFHGVFPVLTWDTGTDSSDAPIVTKLEIFYEPIKFIQ